MARRDSKQDSGKKNKASLGILFWIACILLILVLFLFSRQNIQRVLQNTQFIEVISQSLGSEEPSSEAGGEEESGPAGTEGSQSTESGVSSSTGVQGSASSSSGSQSGSNTRDPEGGQSGSSIAVSQEQTGAAQGSGALPGPAGTSGGSSGESATGDSGSASTENTESSGSSSQTRVSVTSPQEEPEIRTRTYPLYFITLNDDGQVVLSSRQRGIRFIDSPLTATIQALLAGPAAGEIGEGVLSLIPEGSQLISAAIRNGVAFLNFNEAFRFNPLGYEGQKAQLQQIIYTATEFSTVSEVQILIEGQTVNFLGGDGIYVAAPLQRGSF